MAYGTPQEVKGYCKRLIDKAAAGGRFTDVKIMIGRNYVNERVKEFCGANYFGEKADSAVKIANTVFE